MENSTQGVFSRNFIVLMILFFITAFIVLEGIVMSKYEHQLRTLRTNNSLLLSALSVIQKTQNVSVSTPTNTNDLLNVCNNIIRLKNESTFEYIDRDKQYNDSLKYCQQQLKHTKNEFTKLANDLAKYHYNREKHINETFKNRNLIG